MSAVRWHEGIVWGRPRGATFPAQVAGHARPSSASLPQELLPRPAVSRLLLRLGQDADLGRKRDAGAGSRVSRACDPRARPWLLDMPPLTGDIAQTGCPPYRCGDQMSSGSSRLVGTSCPRGRSGTTPMRPACLSLCRQGVSGWHPKLSVDACREACFCSGTGRSEVRPSAVVANFCGQGAGRPGEEAPAAVAQALR
jgi:hypothetical protein